MTARAIGAGLRGLLAAALVYAALLCVSWLSLGLDPTPAAANVRHAIASGQIGAYDISFANAQIGSHQFNDCLILDQALARHGTRAQMAVTPANDLVTRNDSACLQLRASLSGHPGPLGFYQNYIHGHTVLARVLLAVLPVEAIRDLYQLVIFLLVVAGAALACLDLWRRGAGAASLFWLAFFVAFSRFFAIGTLGQSLGHGPADAVLLGYALWLEVATLREHAGSIMWPAAVFGALTMAFEFLTGGLPLGLCLTLAGAALAARDGPEIGRRAFDVSLAFLAACGGMVAIKVALTIALFGTGAVTGAASDLAVRMSDAVKPDQRVAPDVAGVSQSLLAGLGEMAGTRPALAAMFLALSVALGAAGWSRLRHTPQRALAAWLAGSNLILLGWSAVFHEHFYIHAWFMVRIFAWTMATGFALFAIGLVADRHTQN